MRNSKYSWYITAYNKEKSQFEVVGYGTCSTEARKNSQAHKKRDKDGVFNQYAIRPMRNAEQARRAVVRMNSVSWGE